MEDTGEGLQEEGGKMIRFNCDYSEGAHRQILQKMMETNMEQTPGYSEDEYCMEAAGKIRTLCEREDAAVHFLVGGTQTNLTVISAALRPHQGALCAESGHINTHETGAIEACGHKVLTVPSQDGKITAAQVEEVYRQHVEDESFEHIVQPKLVYISNPTEYGTIYYKEELEALSASCRKLGLYLYMDGARLGYGLMAEDNDLTLADIARLCDIFYIGGTKVGALFGEAVVIVREELKEDFRYIMKQKGGMLAKGRLLGIQFSELFRDDLYFRMAKHADEMAELIREACEKKGYPLLVANRTNQVFPVLPDVELERLKESYGYSYWERVDETHSAVRFCTSWATSREDVLALIRDL